MSNKLIIVMGVSGSGKSTIGKGIADKLGIKFYDGDDFHSQTNINKMASGQPLNDNDRKPWLDSINKFARASVLQESIVVACSALKEDYRLRLSRNVDTLFVYLKGSKEIIIERMKARTDHFMPSALLDSQFEDLEEPKSAIEVDIRNEVSEIIEEAIRKLVL